MAMENTDFGETSNDLLINRRRPDKEIRHGAENVQTVLDSNTKGELGNYLAFLQLILLRHLSNLY